MRGLKWKTLTTAAPLCRTSSPWPRPELWSGPAVRHQQTPNFSFAFRDYISGSIRRMRAENVYILEILHPVCANTHQCCQLFTHRDFQQGMSRVLWERRGALYAYVCFLPIQKWAVVVSTALLFLSLLPIFDPNGQFKICSDAVYWLQAAPLPPTPPPPHSPAYTSSTTYMSTCPLGKTSLLLWVKCRGKSGKKYFL